MTRMRTVVGLPGDTVVLLPDAADDLHAREGRKVEIVGFEEIAYGRTHNHGLTPGIYGNPAYPIVAMAPGRNEAVPRHLLSPEPGSVERTVPREALRKADLPETPYWEMDVVEVPGGERAVVDGIDYLAFRGSGANAAFRCRLASGGQAMLAALEMRLLERGNVWLRAHGGTPAFDGPTALGSFHRAVGEHDEIRNPASGNYAWTLEQAVEALAAGDAHGFNQDGVPVGTEGLYLTRFRDPDVGEAVRLDTMERLGIAQVVPGP